MLDHTLLAALYKIRYISARVRTKGDNLLHMKKNCSHNTLVMKEPTEGRAARTARSAREDA